MKSFSVPTTQIIAIYWIFMCFPRSLLPTPCDPPREPAELVVMKFMLTSGAFMPGISFHSALFFFAFLFVFRAARRDKSEMLKILGFHAISCDNELTLFAPFSRENFYAHFPRVCRRWLSTNFFAIKPEISHEIPDRYAARFIATNCSTHFHVENLINVRENEDK